MTTIEGLQEAVARVAESVGPSVVGIGHRWARGSGVVIAPGRVLTNAHNLRGEGVAVTFADGRTERGRPAGVDLDGDLAVIEVDTAEAPALSLNGASAPSIGKAVLALSNPGGLGLRVTFGLVSGTERSFRGPRGRRITGTLEHTAPLLPGSSGGPVVDPDGHLLGINTNRLGEGFYLAIPAGDPLRERVDALGRGETPQRRRLGVAIASGQVARGLRRAVGLPEVDGLLVRGVEEGGPADRAGLEEGDLLIAANERELHSFDDLAEALESSTGAIELRVLRGTEERTVSVELNET
ncbi:MAG: PDZ domain-containing protein [Actinobacteria bacterium]|nr:PDZ domain-containing protein [Actinomycetota bacterium]